MNHPGHVKLLIRDGGGGEGGEGGEGGDDDDDDDDDGDANADDADDDDDDDDADADDADADEYSRFWPFLTVMNPVILGWLAQAPRNSSARELPQLQVLLAKPFTTPEQGTTDASSITRVASWTLGSQ